MFRFPNPGSNPETWIRVHRALFERIGSHTPFDLDDMGSALVEIGLVTSSGAVGGEALRRSTRPDRSLDPIYNNSKMFAENSRALGWITSTEKALLYQFTPLGQHVAVAAEPQSPVAESVMGIATPAAGIDRKYNQKLRPIHAILRTMKALDGRLSREEMILGPLSLSNDREVGEFDNMVARLNDWRQDPGSATAAAEAQAKSLRIQVNTMQNYTRFPLAVLPWLGWTEKDGRALRLTDAGREALIEFSRLRDIRLDDFKRIPAELHRPVARLAHECMIRRAGQEASAEDRPAIEDLNLLRRGGFLQSSELWFSPFQQLSIGDLRECFPQSFRDDTGLGPPDGTSGMRRPRRTHPTARLVARRTAPAEVKYRLNAAPASSDAATEHVADDLRRYLAESHGDTPLAVEHFVAAHENDDQGVFYPLVVSLLRLLGLRAELTRKGVNSQRNDASILLDDCAIPVEIKSPAEEREISVKAVRQALENKIILLSRSSSPGPSTPELTSLVIGYSPPRPRSEVTELILDIYSTFGFRIGIVPIQTLVKAAMIAVSNRTRGGDFRGLREALGVVDFASD